MKKTMLFAMRSRMFYVIVLVLIGVSSVSAQTKAANAMSAVTSINQLNGTWVGTTSSTQTMRSFMESQGETWTSTLQELFGDMKVKITFDVTMNVKASTRMYTITGGLACAFFGGNIKTVWPVLKELFADDETATADDAKYTIISNNSETDSFTDKDLKDFQINQNGTKIKLSLLQYGITFLTDDFELIKQ